MKSNTVPEIVATNNFQVANKVWIQRPHTHLIFKGQYWGCRAQYDDSFLHKDSNEKESK